MYKVLGLLNIAVGLFATFQSLFQLLFPASFYVYAVNYKTSLIIGNLANLKFLLVLTMGLAGIFLGYKTIQFRDSNDAPIAINWYFMSVSIALDTLVLVGVVSGV